MKLGAQPEAPRASLPAGGQPFRLRLPGFLPDQEVGLGDALKKATAAVGIRPCAACSRRAAALNHRLVFTGRP
ncbi:MAG TPA: hypothetical protein VLX28_17855 [Thermoanaerobaculia bacterium]|nr:hypothetical protein [Thermoanaerobaculia bacterium]